LLCQHGWIGFLLADEILSMVAAGQFLDLQQVACRQE
jgi:hypothetical protein